MVNGFRQVAVHCKNNGMYVARRWSPCEFPENLKTLTGLMASLAIAPGKLTGGRTSPLPEPFPVRPGMAGLPIGLAASLSSATAEKET
jgi:hypothetical protein